MPSSCRLGHPGINHLQNIICIEEYGMSNHIRQRLLESEKINLQHILDKLRSLDAAQKDSEEFAKAGLIMQL